jgi:hypothetical protein
VPESAGVSGEAGDAALSAPVRLLSLPFPPHAVTKTTHASVTVNVFNVFNVIALLPGWLARLPARGFIPRAEPRRFALQPLARLVTS